MGGTPFPQGAAPGWYVLPFQGSRSPRHETVPGPSRRSARPRLNGRAFDRPTPQPIASTGQGPCVDRSLPA
jgi:hypothetical protein